MLYSFPNETKLDIFKCLNYQQLLAFKLSNVYFRNFVIKYEGEFAKEKFNMISLGYLGRGELPRQFIKPKAEDFDSPLPKELEEKFKNGFGYPIPLFLSGHGPGKEDLILETG
ncbi:unnamed protein product [Meloidogyne enterolobii]|uniref:Uncharacterized protein n=1 Tax=Meloidogyne enterolobii TaxID=390850 RepID=A0ACB0YST3_MELEN